MRIHYSTLTRPKQAAMRIAKFFPDKPLHVVQHAIAMSTGYGDWHELNAAHNTSPPSALDQDLPVEAFHDRLFHVIHMISNVLKVPDGDVQYAVSQTRLTGDRSLTFEDHEAIRTRFWRAFPMPFLGKNRVGATCYTEGKGRAYQKHHRDLVYCVTEISFLGARTRPEIRIPRKPMKDFVPLRLWLPYGWWTCGDGSEVFYSRDYMPLWRVRRDAKPERLVPWMWIKDIQQHNWFGRDGTWHKPPAIAAAKARLAEFGVSGLPILADALPTIVNHGDLDGKDIVKEMKERMAAEEKSYYPMESPHLRFKTNSFVEFIFKQRPSASPAGDFIRDAQDDPTFPSATTWDGLEHYLVLKGASSAAIKAGRLVWIAFTEHKKRAAT